MRQVKIWFDDTSATYSAEVRDDNGLVESAVVCEPTKHSLDVWLNEHKVSKEEYQNAIFNY